MALLLAAQCGTVQGRHASEPAVVTTYDILIDDLMWFALIMFLVFILCAATFFVDFGGGGGQHPSSSQPPPPCRRHAADDPVVNVRILDCRCPKRTEHPSAPYGPPQNGPRTVEEEP